MRHPPKTSALYVIVLAILFLTCFLITADDQKEKNNVKIGVIYEEGNGIGKRGLSCIRMAISDFYASHGNYTTRLLLYAKEYTNGDLVGAAAAALYLIKNVQVEAIIGPTSSMEAEFVTSLGQKAQVPIITYSATSPLLSPSRNSYFIRVAQSDSSQAQPITALIQAFGWREVVPIYVDNEYGWGLMPRLVDSLEKIDVRVPYKSVISVSATDDQIIGELKNMLNETRSRVFVVHMMPELGSRLFLKATKLNLTDEGTVWITTTSIGNEISSLDPDLIESIQGVLSLKTYFPKTNKLSHFVARWENQTSRNTKLDIYGLWAYDAAFALAMAVEEAGVANHSSSVKQNITSNSTDLDSIRVSPVGPQLLKSLSNIRFKGLSGEFQLANGQLQSSTYQIMNLISPGGREIGFWNPKNGLVRELNSNSKAGLKQIIWPGEPTSVPSGLKKLRIMVPARVAYNEFLTMTKDNNTKKTKFSGYCIDVFEAVMANLSHSVAYEYVPYIYANSTYAGSYDELVDQVVRQEYDAVVGDVTIIASRSLRVEFTLPYTESGVTMVVPMRDNRSKNAWVFLKPLTWDLWVATLSAFVFMAFVIWVLEHRINEEFRGPPLHQAGTSLYYSFSMMVFAQKENVFSNLARFVAIIWVFVVLILTQSYTASLTSMLTVQQLQPTITDVNQLIRNGEFVGYQEASFVKDLLITKDFNPMKLRSYTTMEDLDKLLTNGSTRGGIAAVFDEIPYMRLFLAEYCSKYTMVPPSYKTDGFGFVFPQGSPLVSDFSRAILNVTEGPKMEDIEKKWNIQRDTCNDTTRTVSSTSLSLDSFYGLFIITGASTAFSLLVFIANFLYEHKNPWVSSDTSILTRLRNLLRAFDQRDRTSHTFRKSELFCRTSTDANNGDGPTSTRPSTNCPPSPSAYSLQPEDSFAFNGGGESPLSDHSYPNLVGTQVHDANARMVEETDYNNRGETHTQDIDEITVT